MWKYRCEYCGAALDPGEKCDCQEEQQEARAPLTMEDWRKAGDFVKAAKPGDAVEEEIVEEFVNVLPPTTLTGRLVQAGEEYSFDFDPRVKRHRATYITFAKRDGQWHYCGLCFEGDDKEPSRLAG